MSNIAPRKKLRVQGFTLLEFLIYIGIVSIILATMMLMTSESILLGAKSDTLVSLHYNARFVIDRIAEEIRNATAINEASSVFSTHPGTLSLATANPLTDPTVIDVNNNAVRITRGASSPIVLTSNATRATQLIFFLHSKAGTPGTVKIIFQLSPADARQSPPITIETSASLRQ